LIIFLNLETIAPYLYFHRQVTINLIFFFWIIALVVIPIIWPYKRGDIFTENFKHGLDPRIWQYEGDWKVELSEDGKSVLTVTDSNLGGLALPCLSWTDYEIRFDMRILNKNAGWIIRASGLYDYVLQKIDQDEIVSFYRIIGALPEIGRMKHGQTIELDTWYSLIIFARGEWLSVYLMKEGKENLIFQDRALGDKPPLTIGIKEDIGKGFLSSSQQLVAPAFRTGSFGFRAYGDEKAQFRNITAYRL